MGSLDAILVSIGFRIFGENVMVIRGLQSILYIGTVVTTTILAKRLLKSKLAALFAGLIIGLPPVNVVLYTTVSLGGYSEMLLIGNLLLLSGISILDLIRNKKEQLSNIDYLGIGLWGLGAGFALWVIGLTLVITIPLFIGFIWSCRHLRKRIDTAKVITSCFLGGIIGSSPWWITAVLNKNILIISELVGAAIADANQGFILLRPLSRLLNLIVFGGTVVIGLRPPWSIQWLVLPLLPMILFFWIVVLLYSYKKIKEKSENYRLAIISGIGIVLSIGFIFTPFGDDPSGRYFVPMIVPMAIYGAAALIDLLGRYPVFQTSVLVLILAYNIAGTIQANRSNPTGLTTQFDPVTQIDHGRINELMDFLLDKGITRGYSNYWVSYPLAFLSNEEIVFVPRLPYHEDFRYTARDNRYPPYTELVESSSERAFITTLHPLLDDYLRDQFKILGITWSEETIGDYHIFYNLSENVSSTEIGLGQTTKP
jgi:4-amino-4-deoxy-L-arabinose transferase-like glycosyltransferase